MSDFRDTILALVRGNNDLTCRQIAILLELSERRSADDRQVKYLADALDVSRATITRAGDRLTTLDLMKREPMPTDRRGCVFTLTREGVALVRRMVGAARKPTAKVSGRAA